jgi:hypothetical protein
LLHIAGALCARAEKEKEEIEYVIDVKTSDVSHASTDSRVYVVLCGEREDSEKLWLEGGHFERGSTENFRITLPQMLSPLREIRVGTDYKGRRHPDWHLDSVRVNCPRTGIEQLFTCRQPLSKKDGDRKIERTLREEPRDRRGGPKCAHLFPRILFAFCIHYKFIRE